MMMPNESTHLDELGRLERRLELLLRDLRIYRKDREKQEKDKGVLGSRGLTEYVVDCLKVLPTSGMKLQTILWSAEKAGYAVPTIRTMSKRLTERAYRVGDIGWSKEREWHWKGVLSGKSDR